MPVEMKLELFPRGNYERIAQGAYALRTKRQTL